MAARHRVFISYAHADEPWRRRVAEPLQVLEKQGLLDVWDDRRLRAGADWFATLHAEMLQARVALLLVSSAFLTSDFILEHEVPRLFDTHATDGLRIFPLLVRPCPWQEVAWLARMQMRPRDAKALSSFRGARLEEMLSDIAREIGAACRAGALG